MIKKIKFNELKNENFTIIPIPLEDEILSSWIVRVAYAHKTHPHTFVNQYINYRPYSFFLSECDLTLDETMINTIDEKCRYNIDVRSLMLTTYGGYIQENIYDNNPTIFFAHQKYCPICLREDKVPYFRKKWRVILYNICHKHSCYLYEHCPSCKSNLDISKMHNNKLPYTHCHKCGFELKRESFQSIKNIFQTLSIKIGSLKLFMTGIFSLIELLFTHSCFLKFFQNFPNSFCSIENMNLSISIPCSLL
jgi:Zn ribbon nucleic-acid-binding protein